MSMTGSDGKRKRMAGRTKVEAIGEQNGSI